MSLKIPVTLFLDNLDEHSVRGKHLQPKKKLKNVSPLSYIDLLIVTLTQHEKVLCSIIEKLESISEKLEEISSQLAENRNNNCNS